MMKPLHVVIWFQVRLRCGHMSDMTMSACGDVRHPRVREKARRLYRDGHCAVERCLNSKARVA